MLTAFLKEGERERERERERDCEEGVTQKNKPDCVVPGGRFDQSV